MFQKLTAGESVHLLDWPETGHINELVLSEMRYTRDAITTGLAQRAEAGIKVRQPLSLATVWNAFNASETDEARQNYLDIISEELNVKEVKIKRSGDQDTVTDTTPHIELDLEITPELKMEGQMREVIRNVQQARKQAGLEVDDRIKLGLQTDDEGLKAVFGNDKLVETIKQETLATGLLEGSKGDFEATVKVDGAELHLSLAKSS